MKISVQWEGQSEQGLQHKKEQSKVGKFRGLGLVLTALTPCSDTSLGCSRQPPALWHRESISEPVAFLTPLLIAAPGVPDMS